MKTASMVVSTRYRNCLCIIYQVVLICVLILLSGWLASWIIYQSAVSDSFLTKDFYMTHQGQAFLLGDVDANRPPYKACGKFGGVMVEVLGSYVPFWAEYEGVSYWEPGFENNNRGCDANLKSLSLAMTWPELKPSGNQLLAKGLNFDGILISLSEQSKIKREGGLHYLIDKKLAVSNEREERFAAYSPKLELHSINEEVGVSRTGTTTYWGRDESDKLLFVAYCSRVDSTGEIYWCKGFFELDELPVNSMISFAPDKLYEWRSILAETKIFIVSTIKD